ncbi:hypothetical protein [Kutzneria buriramensis]|uniref:Uncharacterized protein n=1 Tax=Kutzneria buriramensis TaxID=1045776 RepID=A0A3E0GW56_9PSEU|nr:hypothetical protein [Kutzneria buriramensis]REH27741.1 hypothetical protein BCF44_12844 [Kutzneria buriramensis]
MSDHAGVLALADQFREAPNDGVAAELAERSRGRWWLGKIPAATEAAVDVMYQFLERYPDGSDSPLQVVPSTIEPPSAQLAFHMVFPRAEFHPQGVDEPDARKPLYPGAGVAVWQYKGMLPRAAVKPPSPELAALVRAAAVPAWPDILAVHERAAVLADVSLDDLLGVLVHPPAPDEHHQRRPDVWIRSVQVMACLGIAWHGVEHPWRGSHRAQVLTELCLGPEDWITEAAAFAMVAAAWADPALRRDAGTTVAMRWIEAEKASHTRPVTILESLTELVLACPWLDAHVTELAAAVLVNVRQEEPEPVPAERIRELQELARSYAPDRRGRRWFRFGRR